MTVVENDVAHIIYNISEECLKFANQELDNIKARKAKYKTACNIAPFLFGFCVMSKLAHVRIFFF